MLDDHGFETYEESAVPLAYLITFRTYGTWLPGDPRGWVDRVADSRREVLGVEHNKPLHDNMRASMKLKPVILDRMQREIVSEAISKVCSHRGYDLKALHVRSNHAHSVVFALARPERIVNEFKAYGTRALRNNGHPLEKVWSRGASTKYLWKPAHVSAAIEYVLYSQGNVPFETVVSLD